MFVKHRIFARENAIMLRAPRNAPYHIHENIRSHILHFKSQAPSARINEHRRHEDIQQKDIKT